MKKSGIIICIIVLFSMNSFAQPQQKGKFFIGGLAAFSISNNSSEGISDYRESTRKSLDIGTPFGYFVSNTFLVGLIPGYERYGSTSESKYSQSYRTDESKNNQLAIGPFVRSYFRISEKVSFFLDLNAIVGFGKKSSSSYTLSNYDGNAYSSSTEGKLLSISTEIYPGVSIQLSKCFFIDVGVGRLGHNYNKYTPETKSDQDEESINDSFSFSFNTFRFGLSAKLGK